MCPRFNRPCYAGMLHNSTSSPSKPTGDLGLLYFTLLYLAPDVDCGKYRVVVWHFCERRLKPEAERLGYDYIVHTALELYDVGDLVRRHST